jgi:hypothetical protein
MKHLQLARSCRYQSQTLVDDLQYALFSFNAVARPPDISEPDVDDVKVYTLAVDEFNVFVNDIQLNETTIKWTEGAQPKTRAPYHGDSRANTFKKQQKQRNMQTINDWL